ncbi:hypothetical protein OG884_22290 [Streptosporangium sp. NBC_01755]|uniref:hypothetical protein n=1 Tax=unclassified Streptosporangium TaxID=2632669 RepID=UPI002DDA8B88|nr:MULTISPECIES: hypothetical protein [unclassified Streptosporangium]WSA24308.1 hypothetical protein OIE13_25635 [Streptosporangium sp. NBC_01810]WSC97618.1 hypothetical protein OG884_22290 [Streptosporangium sp. NBC_01755]
MTLPVQVRSTESAGRRALWLTVTAVVMTLVLPLAGLVMAIFALVTSVRAIRTLRSIPKPAGTAVAGVVLSVGALLVSTSVTAMQFYFGAELTTYTECGKGAGTVSAQNECVERLERAMEKKMPFVQPGQLQFPFPP